MSNPQTLIRSLLLGCALLLTLPAHAAVSDAPAVKKKVVKKGASKKVAPAPLQVDDDVPDTRDAVQTEFSCELGNKIAIFAKQDDAQHITLRWQEKLLRLTRVETTTGADRFESLKHGLVWIGIPAKGILLDSKKGRQLANECKNAEQLKPAALIATPESAATPVSTTIILGN